MKDLINKVEQWAIKHTLDKANPEIQAAKIVEEFGETVQANVKGRKKDLKDGIGDTLVTIIISALQLKIDCITYDPEAVRGDIKLSNALASLSNMVDHAEIISAGHKNLTRNKYYRDHASNLVEYLKKLAIENGWTLEECLYVAYDEIKDREVTMVNGTLIKDKDLKEIN